MKDPRIDSKAFKKATVEKTDVSKILTTEHWNGSVDKTVKVKGLKLSLTAGATPDKSHIAAILELEEATKENQLAKHSDNAEWLRYTTRRLRVANERLLEVQ